MRRQRQSQSTCRVAQPPCQTHLGVSGGFSASSCCREYTRAAPCRGGGGGGVATVPSRCGAPCACVCAAAVLAWCARSAAATSNGPSGWRAGGHGGGDSSASASPGGPTARCGQRDVDADAHGGAGGRCKNALLNAAASLQSGNAGIAAAGAPQGALSMRQRYRQLSQGRMRPRKRPLLSRRPEGEHGGLR